MSKEPDYQALQAELEAITAKLQGGDLGIDEALPAYERGMQLIKELETYLREAQNKITELRAKTE